MKSTILFLLFLSAATALLADVPVDEYKDHTDVLHRANYLPLALGCVIAAGIIAFIFSYNAETKNKQS